MSYFKILFRHISKSDRFIVCSQNTKILYNKKNLYLEFPLVVLLVLISVLFCIMQNVVTLTRLSISKIAVFVSNNIVLCHCDLINNSYNVPSFLLCTYTMYRSWNLNWASYGSTYRRPRKFKHPINKVNTTINDLLDRLSLS